MIPFTGNGRHSYLGRTGLSVSPSHRQDKGNDRRRGKERGAFENRFYRGRKTAIKYLRILYIGLEPGAWSPSQPKSRDMKRHVIRGRGGPVNTFSIY